MARGRRGIGSTSCIIESVVHFDESSSLIDVWPGESGLRSFFPSLPLLETPQQGTVTLSVTM